MGDSGRDGGGLPPGERYQAFYCEENIWWLARSPQVRERERWAVFISNPNRTCAIWAQRAGPPDRPVVWDYHVVLLAKSCSGSGLEVWDLDSRLLVPCPADRWLQASFRPSTPSPFQPYFRVVDMPTLDSQFASDRRHMRDASGLFRAPPPPWPCIVARSGAVHTLDAFVEINRRGPGRVMDFERFVGWVRDAPRLERPASIQDGIPEAIPEAGKLH